MYQLFLLLFMLFESYLRNLCLTQNHKDFLLHFLLEVFFFFSFTFWQRKELEIKLYSKMTPLKYVKHDYIRLCAVPCMQAQTERGKSEQIYTKQQRVAYI